MACATLTSPEKSSLAVYFVIFTQRRQKRRDCSPQSHGPPPQPTCDLNTRPLCCPSWTPGLLLGVFSDQAQLTLTSATPPRLLQSPQLLGFTSMLTFPQVLPK